MADEEDLLRWSGEGDWKVSGVDPGDYTVLLPQDIHPLAYSKYPLQRLVKAAYDGDLQLLEKMLDREDPICGFHHDINAFHEEINALHAAAMNGQLEAVELLLRAGADPHIRQSMPRGRDPKDGETAREMADKWGWDDIVEVLRRAEEQTPKGIYQRYGTGNNAKLWPIGRPEGLDPEQERRARRKHKGMLRPLPSREDRKFYGDLVFGVTHGWDQDGNVIKRQAPFAQGPMGRGTEGAAQLQQGDASAPVRSRVALVFPDQGAVFLGMLSGVEGYPKVRDMLATAQLILGYNVRQLCAEGPLQRLEEVEVAQPVTYIASVAFLEELRERRPEAVDRPGAVAGLALGEFAALTVAGVMDFETGLRLVKARAEAISAAANMQPQGTLSVAGLDKERVEQLCVQARQEAGGVCELTSELFQKGCACGGTLAAVEALKRLADEAGALQTNLLRATGAMHSPLMFTAKQALEAAVQEALPKMRAPRCDVYMNTTGQLIRAGTPPGQILPLLCDQLTSRVLWDACVRGIISTGAVEFYEVGHQKSLKAMMKRIDQSVWSRMETVGA